MEFAAFDSNSDFLSSVTQAISSLVQYAAQEGIRDSLDFSVLADEEVKLLLETTKKTPDLIKSIPFRKRSELISQLAIYHANTGDGRVIPFVRCLTISAEEANLMHLDIEIEKTVSERVGVLEKALRKENKKDPYNIDVEDFLLPLRRLEQVITYSHSEEYEVIFKNELQWLFKLLGGPEELSSTAQAIVLLQKKLSPYEAKLSPEQEIILAGVALYKQKINGVKRNFADLDSARKYDRIFGLIKELNGLFRDTVFNALGIDLDPKTRTKLDEGMIMRVKALSDQFKEAVQAEVKELFIESVKVFKDKGLESITHTAPSGPPGGGKGTVFSAGEEAAKEYLTNTKGKHSGVENPFMSGLLDFYTKSKKLASGTGAMYFRPAPESIYDKLDFAAVIDIVGPQSALGLLVSDIHANVDTTLMIVLRLCEQSLEADNESDRKIGAFNVVIDVVPRTVVQVKYFNELAAATTKEAGIPYTLNAIYLDLLTPSQLEFINSQDQSEVVKQAAILANRLRREGGALLEVVKSSGEENMIAVYIMQRGLTDNLIETIEEQYRSNAIIMNLVSALKTGLQRCENRATRAIMRNEAPRGDDMPIKYACVRVPESLEFTLPSALVFDNPAVIAGNQSPDAVAEAYDICLLQRIAAAVNTSLDLKDEAIQAFIALHKSQSIARAYPNGDQILLSIEALTVEA